MSKIHFTHGYKWNSRKRIAVTLCGLYVTMECDNNINVTIIESSVNCKKCNAILKKLNGNSGPQGNDD